MVSSQNERLHQALQYILLLLASDRNKLPICSAVNWLPIRTDCRAACDTRIVEWIIWQCWTVSAIECLGTYNTILRCAVLTCRTSNAFLSIASLRDRIPCAITVHIISWIAPSARATQCESIRCLPITRGAVVRPNHQTHIQCNNTPCCSMNAFPHDSAISFLIDIKYSNGTSPSLRTTLHPHTNNQHHRNRDCDYAIDYKHKLESICLW
ncbi:MAG: hypothetical protein JWP89_5156 [Schlesneria sp.]|nr:hypothetical protein [Schlesneria sp.]